ncbi:hypothetical protein E2C01_030600 [Portunus trituberculatus]|uniref:Uncharacterized protein n=1 Tax=Portunus trituberculatus TaxID=210409 RepID=A0A5B7EV96_PORTR|nr:hypothetical protein [Portunus trituberculatus]
MNAEVNYLRIMSVLDFECMTVTQIISHSSLCAIQPLFMSFCLIMKFLANSEEQALVDNEGARQCLASLPSSLRTCGMSYSGCAPSSKHEEVQALLPSMSPRWQDIGSFAGNYHMQQQQQQANTTTECVECTLHNTMKACQSILGHFLKTSLSRIKN